MSTCTFAKYAFTKYEGAGNDFILIDDRSFFFPLQDSKLVQRLCHRKFGVGADGVILLQKDEQADFRMRIFNSDGSEAESCGNGLRCLLRFIGDLGCPLKNYSIAVGNRIVEGGFEGDRIWVKMGIPTDLKLNLRIGGKKIHFVNTGVPHAVLFVSDVEPIDVEEQGAYFRRHSVFSPQGTNVNFAAIQRDGSIRVRTFERGVEGETLACGTGAAAVGIVSFLIYGTKSPALLQFSGGALEVRFQKEDFSDLKLVGPANQTYSGVYA